MVKLRSICQAVSDIRKSDPGTAMTEGFLRLLIENGDVSYEMCGSRVCLNIDILFKELASLFELESEAMPKLRTVKGALKEIKAADAGSVITEYKIRWLIKSGRLRTYTVGSREIIVMESFDDENLLTQESREGCKNRIFVKQYTIALFSRILVEIFEFANGQVDAKMFGFHRMIDEKLAILLAPAMH